MTKAQRTRESHLNEFQAGRVEATFAQIDRLLGTVESLCTRNASPFAIELPDISPEEARFLGAFAQQMRRRMIAALDRLGVPRPQMRLSARNSATVALRFAQIALADLSVSSLRGYGELDPAAAAEVGALASDIEELINRAHRLFQERDSEALSTRLAQVTGPFGEVLRELEKISTRHALLEVRPLIAEAADRIYGNTYDIGVFGRVGAGKSSLINALVGQDILPVGAIPVTAVPLRLQRGASGAVVNFENGEERKITAEEISLYATEALNPGNTTRVRAVEVFVPTLTRGVRFLDTPGVGSLSDSGPAQAFAWLPRCELGLVLIAAGTAVSSDDLALLSGLAHAGIAYQVLISKSDLLKETELAETTTYILRELSGVTGESDIPIHAVSTVPASLRSIESFQRQVLEPLAEDHAAALEIATRRRLHRLLEVTKHALVESSPVSDAPAESDDESDKSSRDSILGQHYRRNAALATIRSETDDLAARADRILEAAASAVASAWLEKRTPKVAAAAARASILRDVGAALTTVRKAVAEASGILEPAHHGEVSASEPAHRMPPLFDAEFLDRLPALDAPRILTAPRRVLAVRRLSTIREALINDLFRYSARLYAWGEQGLKEAPDIAGSSGTAAEGKTPSQSERTLGIQEREALRRIATLIDAPIAQQGAPTERSRPKPQSELRR